MSNIFDLFNKIAAQRENRAANDQPITFIIVGLGNPGPKYETTRHNTGFLATDYIASKTGADITRSKFKALCGEAVFRVEKPSAQAKKTDEETAAPAGASPSYINVRALLLKPQTMMNLSGDAVREAAAFYKISPDHPQKGQRRRSQRNKGYYAKARYRRIPAHQNRCRTETAPRLRPCRLGPQQFYPDRNAEAFVTFSDGL